MLEVLKKLHMNAKRDSQHSRCCVFKKLPVNVKKDPQKML
jgi:hypothetical protein